MFKSKVRKWNYSIDFWYERFENLRNLAIFSKPVKFKYLFLAFVTKFLTLSQTLQILSILSYLLCILTLDFIIADIIFCDTREDRFWFTTTLLILLKHKSLQFVTYIAEVHSCATQNRIGQYSWRRILYNTWCSLYRGDAK